MRAINLVPADARPGRVSAGKSGGAAYGVIGGLVVLMLGAIVFAQAKGKEATANKDLATIQQSAAAYTQVATQYSSFESAASDAQARIATVKSLAGSRFDWAGSLRDLARLIPAETKISALNASVTAGTATSGATQFRSQVQSPAISITGCTHSQNTAANLVTQLQAMRRVTNVTLEYSKSSGASAAGSEAALADRCGPYQFGIDVFFAPGNAQASADTVPSSTPLTTESVSNTATTGTTPATTPATTPSTSGN